MTRDFEPPAIVRGDVDLKALAGRIVARHERSLTDMRDNGLDLQAARKRCQDEGIGWGKWLAENVGMSRPYAWRLMELAGRNCCTVQQLTQAWEEICGRVVKDEAAPSGWTCDVCGKVVEGCNKNLVHCHQCGYHYMNLIGVCTNCGFGKDTGTSARDRPNLERAEDPAAWDQPPPLFNDDGEPQGMWSVPDPAATKPTPPQHPNSEIVKRLLTSLAATAEDIRINRGGIKAFCGDKAKWNKAEVKQFILPMVKALRDTLAELEKELSNGF